MMYQTPASGRAAAFISEHVVTVPSTASARPKTARMADFMRAMVHGSACACPMKILNQWLGKDSRNRLVQKATP